MAQEWTKPYYGTQHLGALGSGRSWVSVIEYAAFAILKRWFPGCMFSPLQSQHDSAEAARAEGEKWLAQQRQPA